MKTAIERAEEFMLKMATANWSWDEMIDNHELLLKDQDKLTRHACADAISDCRRTGEARIPENVARDACMNVKAV